MWARGVAMPLPSRYKHPHEFMSVQMNWEEVNHIKTINFHTITRSDQITYQTDPFPIELLNTPSLCLGTTRSSVQTTWRSRSGGSQFGHLPSFLFYNYHNKRYNRYRFTVPTSIVWHTATQLIWFHIPTTPQQLSRQVPIAYKKAESDIHHEPSIHKPPPEHPHIS